jgi:hypothetical protein
MKKIFAIFIVVITYIYGCGTDDPKTQYSKLVRSEKAKNVRVDSLFMGFYLGMPNKDFYDRCWKLNKEGILMDGVGNIFVLYRLNHNELKYPASMNFYPDFHKEKIYKLRTQFDYESWAPWNKSQYADSLMPDVLNFFKKWYPEGNPFITITDSVKGTIHVKVDGNRRIVISKVDERLVKADFTDMTVEDELIKASRDALK